MVVQVQKAEKLFFLSLHPFSEKGWEQYTELINQNVSLKFDGEGVVLSVNRIFVMDFSGSRASAWSSCLVNLHMIGVFGLLLAWVTWLLK